MCAVATVLLFCTLVLGVVEALTSQPTVGLTTVPGTPEATIPFDVNLTVQIDPSVINTYVYGYFTVRDDAGLIVRPPELWDINFDGLHPPPRTKDERHFTVTLSTPGNYVLWTNITWRYLLGSDWYTNFTTKSIYVSQPPPPAKSTLNLTWLTPLSKHDSFEAGRTIPIRFSVHNDTVFKSDPSVNVTVRGPDGYVFSATYGTHGNDVRIRESAEYYIVYWKTTGLSRGRYTISIKFDEFNVKPCSLSIELR